MFNFGLFSGRPVRIVYQSEVGHSALASFGTSLSMLGKHVEPVELKSKWSSCRETESKARLAWMAQQHGVIVHRVAHQADELRYLRRGTIVEIERDLFFVVFKASSRNLHLIDPRVGIRAFDMRRMVGHPPLHALEFSPAAHFMPQASKPIIKLSQLLNGVSGWRMAGFQLFLLSVCIQIFNLISPLFAQFAIDDVVQSQDRDFLTILTAIFGCMAVLSFLTALTRSWRIHRLDAGLRYGLSVRLFDQLVRLPLKYFQDRSLGDILSRYASLQSLQPHLSSRAVETVVDGVMSLTTLIVILYYSWKLSLVSVVSLCLYILLRFFFSNKIHHLSKDGLLHSSKENSYFLESVRVMQAIKLFGAEATRSQKWQDIRAEAVNSGIDLARYTTFFSSLGQLISSAEYIAIVLIGVLEILDKNFSIGMLVAFQFYRSQFSSKATALVDKFFEHHLLGVHLERLSDLVLTEPEAMNEHGTEIAGTSIELCKLGFQFQAESAWIFRDINLNIAEGECVAICAPSGTGKTTLLRVMLGLLAPTEGQVLVGGQDLRRLPLRRFRGSLSAVMQDDILLNGTIEENIAFFDAEPDLDKLLWSTRIAAISEEIDSFPARYQTLIGDAGVALSGGQRQRILLARALYREPRILILDEATNALDMATEARIYANLAEIGVTRIIVSHRKEALATADRIVLLRRGESGAEIQFPKPATQSPLNQPGELAI